MQGRIVVVLCSAISLTVGCRTSAADPMSYNDCVLAFVKTEMSDSAVAAVLAACRDKFPKAVESGSEVEAKSTESVLSVNELRLLDGRAGLDRGTKYAGLVYNGNSDVVVTDLVIAIGTNDSSVRIPPPDGRRVALQRMYRASVTIPPLTATPFSFDVILNDDGRAPLGWEIVAAKGTPNARTQ